jgi:hypothetical protein
MNEAMKKAWLEIDQILGEPTREELDVFLRTWQRAIQAEREECAKVCEDVHAGKYDAPEFWREGVAYTCAAAIRARGNT